MKILALVASQDSTVEDVKTNGRRQMQALIGKDKEVLFCEYSTIEICRNGELVITCPASQQMDNQNDQTVFRDQNL